MLISRADVRLEIAPSEHNAEEVDFRFIVGPALIARLAAALRAQRPAGFAIEEDYGPSEPAMMWGGVYNNTCGCWQIEEVSGTILFPIIPEREGLDALDHTLPPATEPNIGQLMDVADRFKALLSILKEA